MKKQDLQTHIMTSREQYTQRKFGVLEGKTIEEVRPLNEIECELFGWDYKHESDAMVIWFSDGTGIIPSRDPEGNGAGCLVMLDAPKEAQ